MSGLQTEGHMCPTQRAVVMIELPSDKDNGCMDLSGVSTCKIDYEDLQYCSSKGLKHGSATVVGASSIATGKSRTTTVEFVTHEEISANSRDVMHFCMDMIQHTRQQDPAKAVTAPSIVFCHL